VTRLLVRGAYAGLAMLGAAVLGLGGASVRLTLSVWAFGIAVVGARQFWADWRSSHDEGRRL